MPRARIICIGNPYHPDDWVGPAVYAALRQETIERDIELVDGGLHGLDLLRLMEDVEQVVFADTLVASGESGGAADCDAPQVLYDPRAGDARLAFDHAGGLAYLLRAAPLVLDRLPRTAVIGMAASGGRHRIAELARLCLSIARGLPHAA